jgi:hypothetical protein
MGGSNGETSELVLRRYRQPESLAELTAPERVHLSRIWRGHDLGEVLEDPEHGIEVAEVADVKGQLRYHLYAWNHGACYLVVAGSDEIAAMSSAHYVEAWNIGQRPLFEAMGRALTAAKPRLQQPLYFAWCTDSDWEQLGKDGAGAKRARLGEGGVEFEG